ncbi:MAG: hypothetical protein AB7E46_04020 [Desulfovibrio sp.]|jgi:hypothetical protein
MSIAGIIKHVLDGLWLVGGIGAAADLGLGDFGPEAAALCPREAGRNNCSTLEAASCRLPSSISSTSSATPPSRCS